MLGCTKNYSGNITSICFSQVPANFISYHVLFDSSDPGSICLAYASPSTVSRTRCASVHVSSVIISASCCHQRSIFFSFILKQILQSGTFYSTSWNNILQRGTFYSTRWNHIFFSNLRIVSLTGIIFLNNMNFLFDTR